MHVIVKATLAASALVLAAITIRTVQDASTTSPPPPNAAAPPSATSVTTTARRPCGTVLTEDASGYPLDQATLTLVRSIHDAACRHDDEDLVLLMEPLFGGGTAQEAITGMRAVTPEGAAFDTLAAVLETPSTSASSAVLQSHSSSSPTSIPHPVFGPSDFPASSVIDAVGSSSDSAGQATHLASTVSQCRPVSNPTTGAVPVTFVKV